MVLTSSQHPGAQVEPRVCRAVAFTFSPDTLEANEHYGQIEPIFWSQRNNLIKKGSLRENRSEQFCLWAKCKYHLFCWDYVWQGFMYSRADEIRGDDDLCLDSWGQDLPADIFLQKCHGNKGNQVGDCSLEFHPRAFFLLRSFSAALVAPESYPLARARVQNSFAGIGCRGIPI